MNHPSKEIVERVRREYPAGTRVELVRMVDVQAPPLEHSELSWVWMTRAHFSCDGITVPA